MIEKSRIKKGTIFWLDTDKAIGIHERDVHVIYDEASLYEIVNFNGYSVICKGYGHRGFGQYVMFNIDYFELNAVEVKLKDADMQEIINIDNAIFMNNVYQMGDWSLEIPNDLQIRIDNFLFDLPRKYKLKK